MTMCFLADVVNSPVKYVQTRLRLKLQDRRTLNPLPPRSSSTVYWPQCLWRVLGIFRRFFGALLREDPRLRRGPAAFKAFGKKLNPLLSTKADSAPTGLTTTHWTTTHSTTVEWAAADDLSDKDLYNMSQSGLQSSRRSSSSDGSERADLPFRLVLISHCGPWFTSTFRYACRLFLHLWLHSCHVLRDCDCL
jgi:hypothetical protein